MNSLPLVPRQTVVLLPRRTKVNTSPYCELGQIFLSKEAGHGAQTDLFLTPEKKSIGINAIDDGTTEERHPVENQGRFIRISEINCLSILRIIERTQNATRPAQAMTQMDLVARVSLKGPATVARRPMVKTEVRRYGFGLLAPLRCRCW